MGQTGNGESIDANKGKPSEQSIAARDYGASQGNSRKEGKNDFARSKCTLSQVRTWFWSTKKLVEGEVGDVVCGFAKVSSHHVTDGAC